MRSDPFRSFHVGSLALCAIFLPWSTSLLSISQMLLVANWIAVGIVRKNSGRKWSLAFGQAPAVLFLSFLGLHMIGLIWTSADGMQWGLDLVRILLPVLVFGVVLSASPRLSIAEFRLVLLAGAWSVIISTAVCFAIRGLSADHRDLSMFISHIRLGLLLCISIAILIHYWPRSIAGRIVHALGILWALLFIDRLESLQALVILLAIGIHLIWRAHSRSMAMRSLRILSVVVVIAAAYLGYVLFFGEREQAISFGLPGTTIGGERYVHELDNTERVNGELVWSKIAWAELHRTWPSRSDSALDAKDAKGHVLYATLFRYMSSMHLAKDSAGLMALTDADIQRVHAGTTDHRQGDRWRLHDRIEEVQYELDRYAATGDANGHSVTMRLEYWRIGWQIFKRNWLFGVGTGDTQIEFDRAYEEIGTSLSKEWRHRAHNQYLTLLISFGVVGTLLLAICLVFPAWKYRAWQHQLFVAWAITVGMGSLSDDTIETQAGATLFALYYALFVFASPITDRTHQAADRKAAAHRGVDDDLTLMDARR